MKLLIIAGIVLLMAFSVVAYEPYDQNGVYFNSNPGKPTLTSGQTVEPNPEEITVTHNSKPSYRASVDEVNSGYNKCIFESRMIYFLFDGKEYILRTESFYKDEVNIKITNLGEITLLLGDEVELDINKDGINDILVRLDGEYCAEDKVNIFLKYLTAESLERVVEEEVVEPKIVEEKPSVEKPESKNEKPAVQSESKEPENKLTGFVVAEEQEEFGIGTFFKKLFSKF